MEDSAVLHTDIPKLAIDTDISDIAGRQNADGARLLYGTCRCYHQRSAVPDDVSRREAARTAAAKETLNIPIFSFLKYE